METVAEVIERYKELKENYLEDISEIKVNMKDIMSEIAKLRDEVSEWKGDFKSMVKEFEFIRKNDEDLKDEVKTMSEEVRKCPFCKSDVDINSLNVKANRAYTISSIAITLDIALIIALIGIIIKG